MDSVADEQYGVVMVTAPSKEVAQAIAQTLVESKLAACVSLFPVASIYTWQGNMQQDEEWQLLIKSTLANFAAIATCVQEVHPYDVPEMIALPIVSGSEPYLRWISDSVARSI